MEQETKKQSSGGAWFLTALLVLLGAVFCAAIAWLFLLFYQPIYRAEVGVLFKASDAVPLEQKTKPALYSFQTERFLEDYLKRTRADQLVRQVLKKEFLGQFDLTAHADDLRRAISIKRTENGLRIVVNTDHSAGAKRLARVLGDAYGNAFRSFHEQDKAVLLNEQIKLDQAIRDARTQLTINISSDLDMLAARHFVARYAEAVTTRLYFDIVIEMFEKYKREKISPLRMTEIATAPVVRDKLNKLAILEADIAKIRVRFGEKNTQVQTMEAEYKVIEDQLHDEISQLIQNFASDRDIAAETERRLTQMLLTQAVSNEKRVSIEKNQDKLTNFISERMGVEANINAQNFTIETSDVTVINDFMRPHILQAVAAAFGLAFLGFSLLAFLIKWRKKSKLKKAMRREITDINNSTPVQPVDVHALDAQTTTEQVDDKTLSEKTLMEGIGNNKFNIIALFGATAEEQGARIALKAFQAQKNTLLIDIAGSEITRFIGIHTGLSDVLAGDALLQEAIYLDPETGVDILPNGRVSSLRAATFSNRFPALLQKLVESYSVIILTIAAEPFLTLPDLLQKSVLPVLVKGKDCELWEETLVEAGFTDFYCLD